MTATLVPAAVESAQRPSRRKGARGASPSRIIWLMLVPGVVVLLIFFVVPLFDLLATSLSRWSGIGDRQFIGFGNYAQLLGDARFLGALGRSIALGIGASLGITAIATVLAALVSGGIRGSGIYRILWFLPAIAPASAVAIFWSLSVQPGSGAVNVILGAVGLGDDHAWLADPNTALIVVAAVAIWQGVGFAFLVILGAMEEVPVSVYEAAALDGCSPIRTFFSITLPLIRPVLSMIALLEIIWAFNGFTLVWGMTRGGPGEATTILPVAVFRDAFQFGNFGVAAAMSVIGGALLLIVGFVGNWFGSRKAADE